MKVKKKKKSTLMEKETISMGSTELIEFDTYVQPRSKRYVLFKDARDVANRLENKIEHLSELLAECIQHVKSNTLKDRIKMEIGRKEVKK